MDTNITLENTKRQIASLQILQILLESDAYPDLTGIGLDSEAEFEARLEMILNSVKDNILNHALA